MILLLSMPGGAEWLLILIAILGIFCVPIIFYILTLEKTIKAISPENRKVNSSSVWLLIIPFFNVVWQFILVSKIADSLKAEFIKKNIAVSETRPGYTIGLTMCILISASFISLLNIAGDGMNFLPWLKWAEIIFWIFYWVKIADYKKKLINQP